ERGRARGRGIERPHPARRQTRGTSIEDNHVGRIRRHSLDSDSGRWRLGKAAKPERDSAEQVMKPPRTRRKFRSSLFLINFVLIMIPLTYFGYQPLLRLSASIIIASDVPEKSDAILVLNGGEPARAWGAADLYNEKLAQYVIVTKELPSLGEEELR